MGEDNVIRDAAGVAIGEFRPGQDPLEQRVVYDADGRALPSYHPRAEALLAAPDDTPPGRVEAKYSVVERPSG